MSFVPPYLQSIIEQESDHSRKDSYLSTGEAVTLKKLRKVAEHFVLHRLKVVQSRGGIFFSLFHCVSRSIFSRCSGQVNVGLSSQDSYSCRHINRQCLFEIKTLKKISELEFGNKRPY